MSWLIRICEETSLNLWSAHPPNYDQLAGKWFDNFPQGDQPSVFETDGLEGEAEAVAAFTLTNPPKKLGVWQIMRIDWSDLEQVRIRDLVRNDVPGTTGVVRVDFHHWELPGDKEALVRLFTHIAQRAATKSDRFHWFSNSAIRPYLGRFQEEPDGRVINEAKRRCQAKLAADTTTRRHQRGRIENELQECPPEIPWHRIAAVANQAATGNQVQDWLRSESLLRDRYTEVLTG